MKRSRIVAIGLAAAAMTLMMSETVNAKHWRHNHGPSFSFSFGSSHPYYGHPAYRPYYNPYRYSYPVAPRRLYRSPQNAHVSWCYHRYRSYRARDNSFQPYHGPRRQCVSPYYYG
jgi:hypothetical protein